MITLSFGYKKPQTGDKGSLFFPALEGNIQLLNDHTHNGANSSRLTAGSIPATTADIFSAGWGAFTNGHYSQTVTLPGALLYDEYNIAFQITGSGHRINPSIEKVSGTTFNVFVNDNTLDLTVIYS